ncbi:MAG TPA: hypothetical protein VMT18_09550 [Planctomycetota bacterium]|nr:hypothetical protein [Planctomycetota bacterium]
MITRKLGKLLRGKATPFQIVAAATLGALLGFAPSVVQAPALYLILVALLLVTNANLGLALLVAGASKLVALLAVPLSFQVGRLLLDGPTAGLFAALANAPVLAWCGLEYYAVTGGLLVGLVLGLVVGLSLARLLTAFRRRMLAAAANPGALSALAQKPLARFGIWLFFGAQAEGTWEEKLAVRVGNPIRVWGAALLVLLLVGFWFGQKPLASSLARRGMQGGLERANGATVDLGHVELDLEQGSLAVSSLALADPDALARNLFEADALEADLDQADFLRRRFHVAKLVMREAKSGAARAAPGERLAPAPEPEPEESGPGLGDYSIEEILAQYEVWKERLTQTRRWLEELAPRKPETGEPTDQARETMAERLAREVREKGWFGVKQGDLIGEAPTFRLSQLEVDGLSLEALPGRVFDLRGSELSTHPWLLDASPKLELAARDGSIRFAFDLAPASRAGGDGAIAMSWKGLAVDAALAQLKLPGKAPLSGGTLDLALDGAWKGGRIGEIDLPLVVTFHDTVLAIDGLQPTPLDALELRIGLSGSIDAPRIHFDESTLTEALKKAGKAELAGQVQQRLKDELGVDVPLDTGGVQKELEKAAGEKTKGLLEGVLGGKKP